MSNTGLVLVYVLIIASVSVWRGEAVTIDVNLLLLDGECVIYGPFDEGTYDVGVDLSVSTGGDASVLFTYLVEQGKTDQSLHSSLGEESTSDGEESSLGLGSEFEVRGMTREEADCRSNPGLCTEIENASPSHGLERNINEVKRGMETETECTVDEAVIIEDLSSSYFTTSLQLNQSSYEIEDTFWIVLSTSSDDVSSITGTITLELSLEDGEDALGTWIYYVGSFGGVLALTCIILAAKVCKNSWVQKLAAKATARRSVILSKIGSG